MKRTSDMIPDCHPLPVEYAHVRHQVVGHHIEITVEVHTIYKTGVEIEAMHGASVTALTLYDMLKPIVPDVQNTRIRLICKTDVKSDRGTFANAAPKHQIDSLLKYISIGCA